jgi:uncharacterized protein YbjT (DUF2867 family)
VNGRTALLLGATGLVGRFCLLRLLADRRVARVIAPGRREPALPAGTAGAGKLHAPLVDFDHLEAYADDFRADVGLCALGTTIARAGSRERFRAVDLGYVERSARLARAGGVEHFLLVSSIGADARSRIFYSRVKGEAERAVVDIGFPAVTILRPSLLLGAREERRLGEEIAKHLGFLTPPVYRPVDADDVAAVMVDRALRPAEGETVIESREIRRIVRHAL